MVVVSYDRPDNFDQLFATYCESLTKNPISMFPSEVQCTPNKEEAEDTDDEEFEDCVAQYERKEKKPDTGRNAQIKRSIFGTLDGFANTEAMDSKDYPDKIYCVDSTFIMAKLNESKKPVVMAYPGAVVLPIREQIFTRTADDVVTNSCDFSSLYPKTMIRWNICKTAAAFNPNYAVKIDGKLHDPFDTSKFNIAAVPFEFNKTYVPVCVILARPDFKQSALTSFILDIIRLRKETKAKQKEALAAGSTVLYLLLENKQNAYKLVINTTYGAMFTKSFTIFQPYLCSAVTYYGRIALLRFMLTIYYYYATKGIDASAHKRGPLAGDTDSLFIKSTALEAKEIVAIFESWPEDRGIYGIELENSVDDIIFFARKRYVFHFRAGPRMISKGTFVKKQSEGCKEFLYYFLLTLFSDYLARQDVDAFKLKLNMLFIRLKGFCEKNMSHSFTLSKNLTAYKQPNCLHLQLLHLESLTGKAYAAGDVIKYAHYPFVFIPGAHYGPLDVFNKAQMQFIKTKHNSTALVEDFEPFFEGAGLKKSLARGIELDLKATLLSIFTSVAEKEKTFRLQEIFNLEFKSVFGADFLASHVVSGTKRKQPPAEVKDFVKKTVQACNGSILKFLTKTKY